MRKQNHTPRPPGPGWALGIGLILLVLPTTQGSAAQSDTCDPSQATQEPCINPVDHGSSSEYGADDTARPTLHPTAGNRPTTGGTGTTVTPPTGGGITIGTGTGGTTTGTGGTSGTGGTTGTGGNTGGNTPQGGTGNTGSDTGTTGDSGTGTTGDSGTGTTGGDTGDSGTTGTTGTGDSGTTGTTTEPEQPAEPESESEPESPNPANDPSNDDGSNRQRDDDPPSPMPAPNNGNTGGNTGSNTGNTGDDSSDSDDDDDQEPEPEPMPAPEDDEAEVPPAPDAEFRAFEMAELASGRMTVADLTDTPCERSIMHCGGPGNDEITGYFDQDSFNAENLGDRFVNDYLPGGVNSRGDPTTFADEACVAVSVLGQVVRAVERLRARGYDVPVITMARIKYALHEATRPGGGLTGDATTTYTTAVHTFYSALTEGCTNCDDVVVTPVRQTVIDESRKLNSGEVRASNENLTPGTVVFTRRKTGSLHALTVTTATQGDAEEIESFDPKYNDSPRFSTDERRPIRFFRLRVEFTDQNRGGSPLQPYQQSGYIIP